MTICVTKATLENTTDIDIIMEKSKILLKNSGSPQWSGEDGPTLESLIEAIEKELVYIFVFNGKIIGTSILTEEPDEAYSNIQYGSWSDTNSIYYSIHRFAIDPAENGKGYAKLFFNLLTIIARENGAKDIRVDTHPLNKAMQKVIMSNGFEFKGIVNLPISNGERYAYQKVITK